MVGLVNWLRGMLTVSPKSDAEPSKSGNNQSKINIRNIGDLKGHGWMVVSLQGKPRVVSQATSGIAVKFWCEWWSTVDSLTDHRKRQKIEHFDWYVGRRNPGGPTLGKFWPGDKRKCDCRVTKDQNQLMIGLQGLILQHFLRRNNSCVLWCVGCVLISL